MCMEILHKFIGNECFICEQTRDGLTGVAGIQNYITRLNSGVLFCHLMCDGIIDLVILAYLPEGITVYGEEEAR